ncbi:sulfotransferase [Rhodobacteraceae bacterium NNCM2]|nr:sulfotransferase [Coraliihabitans acroporae]
MANTTPREQREMPGQRLLINGLGRSGTSWLMKIFDHHPMVFAAHEPEVFLPLPGERDGPDPAAACGYADALFSARPLRAMRKRPVMRKAYRGALAHSLRLGLMYAASAAALLPGQRRRMLGWQVPDLADTAAGGVTHVVKSVSHHVMLPRLAAHAPSVRILYLLRHPCANVFSSLRGQELNKYRALYLPSRDGMAALYGDTPRIRAMTEADCSQLEILAYRWAVTNHQIVTALAGHPNARILRYEDLCADPIGQSREIFAWAGLDWPEACDAFLRRSLAADGDAEGYHDLVRNPLVAADKWRSQMADTDAAQVRLICQPSKAFELYD